MAVGLLTTLPTFSHRGRGRSTPCGRIVAYRSDCGRYYLEQRLYEGKWSPGWKPKKFVWVAVFCPGEYPREIAGFLGSARCRAMAESYCRSHARSQNGR